MSQIVELSLAALWLLGVPVGVIVAWWFFIRETDTRGLPKWRMRAFFAGLIAASLNVLLGFGLWMFRLTGGRPELWKSDVVIQKVGFWLCPAAFIGAALGERGRASIALSISAMLGFLLWVPFGIL